ncbi:MAG: hypothetical protein MI861_18735, partial [Pirellulales bacterium]|nr:hypothetical protein [Pirellulales bacterium]
DNHVQAIADAGQVRAESIAHAQRDHDHRVAEEAFTLADTTATARELYWTKLAEADFDRRLLSIESTESRAFEEAEAVHTHASSAVQLQFNADQDSLGLETNSRQIYIDTRELSDVFNFILDPGAAWGTHADELIARREIVDNLSIAIGQNDRALADQLALIQQSYADVSAIHSTATADQFAGAWEAYQRSVATLEHDYQVEVAKIGHDLDQDYAAAHTLYVQTTAPLDKSLSDSQVLHVGLQSVADAGALKDFRVAAAGQYATTLDQWHVQLGSAWSALHAAQGVIEVAWATASGDAEVNFASAMHTANHARRQAETALERDERVAIAVADQLRVDTIAGKNDLYAAAVAAAQLTYANTLAGLDQSRTADANDRVWNDPGDGILIDNPMLNASIVTDQIAYAAAQRALLDAQDAAPTNYQILASSALIQFQRESYIEGVNAAANYAATMAPALPDFNAAMHIAVNNFNQTAQPIRDSLIQSLAAVYGAEQAKSTALLYDNYADQASRAADDVSYVTQRTLAEKTLADQLLTATTANATDISLADKAFSTTLVNRDSIRAIQTVGIENNHERAAVVAQGNKTRGDYLADSGRREGEVAARGNYQTTLHNEFAAAKQLIADVTLAPLDVMEAAAAGARATHSNSLRIAANAYQAALTAADLTQIDQTNIANLTAVDTTHLARTGHIQLVAPAKAVMDEAYAHASTDLALANAIAEASFEKEQTRIRADFDLAVATESVTLFSSLDAPIPALATALAPIYEQYFLDTARYFTPRTWTDVTEYADVGNQPGYAGEFFHPFSNLDGLGHPGMSGTDDFEIEWQPAPLLGFSGLGPSVPNKTVIASPNSIFDTIVNHDTTSQQ